MPESAYSLEAPESLEALVRQQVDGACTWADEERDALVAELLRRHGSHIQAILVYGSYLRGKRDTLLDFYVLLDGYGGMRPRWQAMLCRMLPPNVYQVSHGEPCRQQRAKVAVMTLARFEVAIKHDFHSYFWARFIQPCGLLYCRDESTKSRIIGALVQACESFARRVLPRLPRTFTAADLLTQGLALTYRCELRSEGPDQPRALYAHNVTWYQRMTGGVVARLPSCRATDQPGVFEHEQSPAQRARSRIAWALRRGAGKALSVLRLLKAAVTFNGGFDYLLWKIGRHSGITVEPSARQLKYPLIFGWPLLWQLYRRGGFR